MAIFSRLRTSVYPRLPRFGQILVDDLNNLHEYGRFMRVFLTFGVSVIMYKFAETMTQMNKEKRLETVREKAERIHEEKERREIQRLAALSPSQYVHVPSREHVQELLDRADEEGSATLRAGDS